MLTAQGPWVTMKTGPLQLLTSALVGGSLLVLLVWAAWSVPDWKGRTIDPHAQAQPTAARLGLGLTGVRVDQLQQTDPRGMSGYLLPFEIVSVASLGGPGGRPPFWPGRRSGPATGSPETNGP